MKRISDHVQPWSRRPHRVPLLATVGTGSLQLDSVCYFYMKFCHLTAQNLKLDGHFSSSTCDSRTLVCLHSTHILPKYHVQVFVNNLDSSKALFVRLLYEDEPATKGVFMLLLFSYSGIEHLYSGSHSICYTVNLQHGHTARRVFTHTLWLSWPGWPVNPYGYGWTVLQKGIKEWKSQKKKSAKNRWEDMIVMRRKSSESRLPHALYFIQSMALGFVLF